MRGGRGGLLSCLSASAEALPDLSSQEVVIEPTAVLGVQLCCGALSGGWVLYTVGDFEPVV